MSTPAANRRYRLRHPDAQRERDHRRYLRQRDERLEKQREYYKANRDFILKMKRMTGFEKYGTIRRRYE